jgi:hypothetical protein
LRRLLFISIALLISAVVLPLAASAEWQFFNHSAFEESGDPLSVQLVQSSAPEEHASGLTAIDTPLEGFQNVMVPLTINQLKLSLIDIEPESDTEGNSSARYTPPKVGLNTGVKSTGIFKKDLINSPPVFFDSESGWSVSTVILFFGVDLNAGPGYFRTQAFTGKTMSLGESGFDANWERNMNARGFNALAGYKLNDLVTFEAGYGYLDQKDKKGGTSEEAWAIYAQAILSLSPGVNVIPGVGQIDFDQKESKEGSKDNFFAGAKWEINF